MASFFGSEIIYDGIPSSTFGLRLVNFSTGKSDSNAGGEITIIQKYIPRRSIPYYYGRMQNIPLEINLTLASEQPIDAKSRNSIEKWLIGRDRYLPLSVVQSDLDGVTYYVIFKQGTNNYMGNLNRSIEIKGTCNAPWPFEYPNVLTKSYSGSSIVSEDFTFANTSSDSDYLKPSLVFTTSAIGTSCNLTNHTDNNRLFSFTGISANETITVDNDKGIISSDTGLRRMTYFNKNFFRLVPGQNDLTLAGGLVRFEMTSVFARKIGS